MSLLLALFALGSQGCAANSTRVATFESEEQSLEEQLVSPQTFVFENTREPHRGSGRKG